jgi:two-component system sensor histidine kinase PilS (NtrC family)
VAVVLLAVVSLLLFYRTLPAVPGMVELPKGYSESKLAVSLLINGSALYVVALLGSVLSSQLRRARERLAAAHADLDDLGQLHEDIVASLTTGIVTADSDGRITSLNAAAVSLTGYEQADAVGSSLWELFPAPPQADGLAGGGRWEAPFESKASNTLWLELYSSPLRRAGGAAEGTILMFWDMTELREKTAALERAERLAALGKMAARIAHEVRNPLSAIAGAVHILKDAVQGDEDDARLLKIVVHEAERLEGLIAELLDFARPRPLQRVDVDVVDLCREAAEVVRQDPALEGKEVALRLPEATLAGELDPDRIRQALWNLLRNAAEVTPAGGTIVLALRMSDDGQAIEMDVTDQGPGVPEEDRERVFDPFYTTKERGTGIGLAVVRRVAERHGGSVALLAAAEGQGSTFCLRLPMGSSGDELE